MSNNNSEIIEFLRTNHLFSGLAETQLLELASLMREVSFAENEYLIRENDVSDEVYFIKEGEVEISKYELSTQQSIRITTLGTGAVVGEITLLDSEPRSASVRTIKPTTLYVLSISELQALTPGHAGYLKIVNKLEELTKEAEAIATEQPLYSLIVQNLAKNLSQRMRSANDAFVDAMRRELELNKARVAMGMLIINVVALMSLYLLVIGVLNQFKFKLAATTMVSVPLIFIFAGALFGMMKRSGYPLSLYGFTLKNWQRSLSESLFYTFLLCVLVTGYKWVLIHVSPAFVGLPLIQLNGGVDDPGASVWLGISFVVLYLLFVPLQEFITRGVLQSSFQELLVGPHKTLWAIILSNLLFSVTHFHVSLGAGLEVYIPGLFWGWLYARQRSLLGVCVSHLIFGAWALFVLGIF